MYYAIIIRTPTHHEYFTSKHRFKFTACFYAKFLRKCGFDTLVTLNVDN